MDALLIFQILIFFWFPFLKDFSVRANKSKIKLLSAFILKWEVLLS